MRAEDYLESIDFAATWKPDFSPLFENPRVFRALVLDLIRPFRGVEFDKIACPESMGFLLGAAVSAELKKGLIAVRKGGKLPNIKRNIVGQSFRDYSRQTLRFEVNKTLIKPGDKVLVIDDWLETGGQLKGLIKLLEKCGAIVIGISVLGCNTKSRFSQFLGGYQLHGILNYEGCKDRDLTQRLDRAIE